MEHLRGAWNCSHFSGAVIDVLFHSSSLLRKIPPQQDSRTPIQLPYAIHHPAHSAVLSILLPTR